MNWQTVSMLIILLLQQPSDLGLLFFSVFVFCPNIENLFIRFTMTIQFSYNIDVLIVLQKS